MNHFVIQSSICVYLGTEKREYMPPPPPEGDNDSPKRVSSFSQNQAKKEASEGKRLEAGGFAARGKTTFRRPSFETVSTRV